MAAGHTASCQSPKNLATLLKPYGDSAHNTQGKSRNGGGVNPHKCKCGSCLAPLLVLTSAIGCGLKAASASSLLVLVLFFRQQPPNDEPSA